jgi:hypothetical protein
MKFMHNINSNATSEHRQVLKKLSGHLRNIIDQSIVLNAPDDVIKKINKQLANIEMVMQPYVADKRALEYYNPNVSDDINDIQPYSAVSGHYNALAAPINFKQQQDKLLAHVNYGRAYEGPPDCVHGAIISGVYDQLMAIAGMATGKAGPTAYLNIDFHKPTPLFKELEFQAWISFEQDNKIIVMGQCLVNGEIVSSAEALFIVKPILTTN